MDRKIVAAAKDGIYKTAGHLARLKQVGNRDPQSTVDAHVRRLEALRRSGIAERVADSVWKERRTLMEKAQQHDAQKGAALVIELR